MSKVEVGEYTSWRKRVYLEVGLGFVTLRPWEARALAHRLEKLADKIRPRRKKGAK